MKKIFFKTGDADFNETNNSYKGFTVGTTNGADVAVDLGGMLLANNATPEDPNPENKTLLINGKEVGGDSFNPCIGPNIMELSIENVYSISQKIGLEAIDQTFTFEFMTMEEAELCFMDLEDSSERNGAIAELFRLAITEGHIISNVFASVVDAGDDHSYITTSQGCVSFNVEENVETGDSKIVFVVQLATSPEYPGSIYPDVISGTIRIIVPMVE